MLKAGVRKCVYFYFREEIKKKKKAPCCALALCLSQLWWSGKHPAVFLEQQQGSKVGGIILHGKKNHWNSAGDCFSLALLPLCSTQNGSFESERPKKSVLGWGVCPPPMAGCEYCSGHFSIAAFFQFGLCHLYRIVNLLALVYAPQLLRGTT